MWAASESEGTPKPCANCKMHVTMQKRISDGDVPCFLCRTLRRTQQSGARVLLPGVLLSLYLYTGAHEARALYTAGEEVPHPLPRPPGERQRHNPRMQKGRC